MKRRELVGFLPAVALAGLSGCASILNGSETENDDDGADSNDEGTETRHTSSGSSAAKENIRAVLMNNARATEEENLELLRDTLHPNSPSYDSTIEVSKQSWETYDVRTELTIHDITVDRTHAAAEVTLVTEKVSGPEFRDNSITSVQTLRTYQGEWHIYNSTVEEIEYLE